MKIGKGWGREDGKGRKGKTRGGRGMEVGMGRRKGKRRLGRGVEEKMGRVRYGEGKEGEDIKRGKGYGREDGKEEGEEKIGKGCRREDGKGW